MRWRTAEQRADANSAALDTWYGQDGCLLPEPEPKDMSAGVGFEACQVMGCRQLTRGDFCPRHDSEREMYGHE